MNPLKILREVVEEYAWLINLVTLVITLLFLFIFTRAAHFNVWQTVRFLALFLALVYILYYLTEKVGDFFNGRRSREENH